MSERKLNVPLKIFAGLVFFFLVLPLIVVVLASFSPTALVVFPPKGFSLKWYQNIFNSSTNFLSGFGDSMSVGLTATAIDVVLGIAAALSVGRYKFKGRAFLSAFFSSPMYVPSITFAFVLLQIGSSVSGISSFVQILIGHAVIIFPYIVRNVIATLSGYDWELEDAAASLGASPAGTFFRITLPIIRPGVISGAILAFLFSFDEAVLSNLLSSPTFVTLPVRIMNYMEFSFDPTLASVSTILILLSLAITLLAEKLVGATILFKDR